MSVRSSLVPIQVIFIAWFSINYIQPILAISLNEMKYSSLIIECNIYENLVVKTTNKYNFIETETYSRLMRSATSGLEFCRRKDFMREKLLSMRVHPSKLEQLKYYSLSNENISISNLNTDVRSNE